MTHLFRLGPAVAPPPTRPDVMPERTITPAAPKTKPDEPGALPFDNPGTDSPAMPDHDPEKRHQTCFGRNWFA